MSEEEVPAELRQFYKTLTEGYVLMCEEKQEPMSIKGGPTSKLILFHLVVSSLARSPVHTSAVDCMWTRTRLWTRSFARLISAHRSRSTRARLRLRRASWLLGRPSPSM